MWSKFLLLLAVAAATTVQGQSNDHHGNNETMHVNDFSNPDILQCVQGCNFTAGCPDIKTCDTTGCPAGKN